MARRVLSWAGAGLLWIVLGGSMAAAEDPPALAPPAELPTVTAPSPPPESAAERGPQPVLVVPGLTAPRPALVVPRFEPIQPDGPPPLTGPIGSAPPPGSSPPPAPLYSGQPARRGTLTLEPAPEGRLGPARAPVESVPGGPGTAPPGGGSAARPTRPAPPPPRRRLFGLLRPPAPPAPRIEDEPIRVEPRSDPAADAALKRRLEQQIRANVGNQLKALDVRVVDRQVVISARVVRFWQKRSVTRTIEALPALSGLRARVEVTD